MDEQATEARVTRRIGGRTAGMRGRSFLVGATVAGGVMPLALLLGRAARGGLGADPVGAALNQLGMLALILLVTSLACTPLRILTGKAWPMQIRRVLGLLGFGYATLHVLVYLVIDQGLAVGAIVEDVTERPFTLVGALAWLLLLPLAATSTRDATRRLGAARWRRLHRLAYVCAALGVVHFTLRVKKDLTEPAIYGAVLAVLLGVRVLEALRRRRAEARAAAE